MFYLFSTLLHLSGMNDTNGEGLVLVAGQTGLELHWLLLVAVLISSLGAVMDVALSLASSLHELREADGKMSGLQLFAAGMRIGRDMIGTMSNTLILAFAGEAVTTLLLLMAYGWHSSQLFASDYAAIQVAPGRGIHPGCGAGGAHYLRDMRGTVPAAETIKAMPASAGCRYTSKAGSGHC